MPESLVVVSAPNRRSVNAPRTSRDPESFVEAAYEPAHAVGGQLTAARRLGATVGECATDRDAGNDAQGLAAFVERFGARPRGDHCASGSSLGSLFDNAGRATASQSRGTIHMKEPLSDSG